MQKRAKSIKSNIAAPVPASTPALLSISATTGGQNRGNRSRRSNYNDNNNNGSTTNSNRFILKIAIIKLLISSSENIG